MYVCRLQVDARCLMSSQGLSLNPDICRWLDWLANKPWGSCHFCYQACVLCECLGSESRFSSLCSQHFSDGPISSDAIKSSYISQKKKKKKILGLKKITQLLRALVALPEDPSSVPSIHIRPTACTRAHTHTHVDACTHKHVRVRTCAQRKNNKSAKKMLLLLRRLPEF